MAAAMYYGLKTADGTIIEAGLAALPTFDAYLAQNGQLAAYGVYVGGTCYYHTYAYAGQINGTWYHKDLQGSDIGYDYSYHIHSSGVTFRGKFYVPGVGLSSSDASFHKMGNYGTWSGWKPSFTYNLSVNDQVRDNNGTIYTVCTYYVFTISATTNSVGSMKVGNIALYDSSGVLLAGSVSTTDSAASATTITASVVSENSSVSIKVVATACTGSTTSSKQEWHRNYFFNGLDAKESAVSDSDVTFAESQAAYTASFGTADTHTFVVDYGAKYELTISKRTGVSASTVSYARHHTTGDYVTNSISPISLTGSGTLYVESGSNVSASASCSSGYVFATTNGFISQTSGVSSLYGSNSSSVSGTIPTLTKAATFNVTASTYTISVSISDHPTWGTVYIDSSGTTSKTLVQGTTYNFGFVSSLDDYEAPTVTAWFVNGTQISGSSYTASTLSGNVVVTCTLTKNAYPVTVTAGSNGTVSIAGRYNKTSGATLANTGYLYADGRDYMKLTVTPESHYDETSSSRIIDNLTEYSAGGTYCYSLSSADDGSAQFFFNLAECVIKTSTNDPTLCDVSPASQVMRFDSATLVNVYCYIKTAYIGQYRVDYFTMGGAQFPAEAGGSGQYYYSVSASTISGQSEVTFVPHLVNTANPLTVTKSGDTAFAAAYVSIGGTEESMSGTSWTGSVTENTAVVCRAVPTFGGQIGTITSTGITNPSITDTQISFAMPSNAATVTIPISEKEKVTLALCVANATDPTVAVGKVTLTCAQSSSVHEEVTTLSAQSFQIYKNTTYRLTATDTDATYTFSGWYLDDSTFVSSDLYIDISRATPSSKYTAKYVMRGTGTITKKYGTKSGDSVVECELPSGSQTFGLEIDTTPDQTDPDKWVIGNNRYIDFHVLDDGTSIESGITYVWTPVRVEVKMDLTPDTDTWLTVWTYDANNPTSRSGRFAMRDSMIVRCVYTKVQAEGYGRVQALFKDGNTSEMGEMSIFATSMLSYYSIGGVAEANCYVGKKVVLTAAPKPGWSFGGWYKFTGGAFVPVTDSDTGCTVDGAILTVDSVVSGGLTYYADFAQSDSYVQAFADGSIAKTFEWRSKVYVGSQFFALRNVRIYSDMYPVGLRIMTATSPNGCFSDSAHTLNLVIQNQSPRQIPTMRLEKYFAFRVTGNGRINHVAIASSMEALK